MITKPTLRTVLLSAALLSSLTLPLATGCVAGGEDQVEFAEEGALDDGGKADRPDLALTAIEGYEPIDRTEAKVGVIKSAAAWEDVFGVEPPADLDFAKHWAVYYAAGARSSGGYQARVDRVRLSDTGGTLKIAAVLDSPGRTCLVTRQVTFPSTVVRIDRPARAPGANRYARSTNVVECGGDDTCADGTLVTEPGYVDGPDAMECAAPVTHCLTRDPGACPQISPLPPGFCADGTVRPGPARYVASADGMECSMPTVHCLTRDPGACPQISPLPPTFCADGTVETEPRFVASADGHECSLPRIHCVADAASCPAP